jgi:hypothetical protein
MREEEGSPTKEAATSAADRSDASLNAAPVVRQTEPRVIPAPLAAAAPPPPVVPKTRFPFGLFFDVSPLWQRSRGFDLFSRRDLSPRVGLTAEMDVVEIDRDTQFSLDLSAAMEQASDTVLGSLETRFTSHHVLFGGRLRRAWHPLFDTHLTVLGGVDRTSTKIGFGGASVDWLPMAQLGAGLSGMMPGQYRTRPGMLIEGGYVLSKKVDLPLSSAEVDAAIERSTANLGTLNRSGPYLRVSIFLRY